MKFKEIAKQLEGIPYLSVDDGKLLYDHVIKTKPNECLELGFAHGVSSCYIAAALQQNGEGHLTSVDLLSSKVRKPAIEDLLHEKWFGKSCYCGKRSQFVQLVLEEKNRGANNRRYLPTYI